MSHEAPRSEESGDSGALHSALNSAFDYVIENRADYYKKIPITFRSSIASPA